MNTISYLFFDGEKEDRLLFEDKFSLFYPSFSFTD